METDVESYLAKRLALLRGRLATVEAKAAAGTLPDVVLKDGDLCISPVTASVPDAAEALKARLYDRLPRIRITELLTEVVQGVSTRSVDDLVKAMGMTGISKSQVSRLCAEIDDKVSGFLNRPLEGDWPYVWLDATYVKARQNGRVVSVAVIIAIGVNGDGRREVLGMTTGASEAETFSNRALGVKPLHPFVRSFRPSLRPDLPFGRAANATEVKGPKRRWSLAL